MNSEPEDSSKCMDMKMIVMMRISHEPESSMNVNNLAQRKVPIRTYQDVHIYIK